MRFISTQAHGVIDYLVGILLIAAPFILGFNQGGAETIVPIVVGCSVLLMNLFSDHEVSMVRSIPMSTHLLFDVIGGLFLALSPWLFGFNNQVVAPHLIVGIFLVASGLMTSRVPAGCRTC